MDPSIAQPSVKRRRAFAGAGPLLAIYLWSGDLPTRAQLA